MDRSGGKCALGSGRTATNALSAHAMRLLLALLALLYGVPLSEVAVAASRAEVVGTAAGASVAAAKDQKPCNGDRPATRPTGQTRLADAAPLPRPAHVRACAIRLPDRARE